MRPLALTALTNQPTNPNQPPNNYLTCMGASLTDGRRVMSACASIWWQGTKGSPCAAASRSPCCTPTCRVRGGGSCVCFVCFTLY